MYSQRKKTILSVTVVYVSGKYCTMTMPSEKEKLEETVTHDTKTPDHAISNTPSASSAHRNGRTKLVYDTNDEKAFARAILDLSSNSGIDPVKPREKPPKCSVSLSSSVKMGRPKQLSVTFQRTGTERTPLGLVFGNG